MITPLANVPYAQLSTVKGLIAYLEELKQRSIVLMLQVPFDPRLYGQGRQHFCAIANPSSDLTWEDDKVDWIYYFDEFTGHKTSIGSLRAFYLSATVRAWSPNMIPPAYKPGDPDLEHFPLVGGPSSPTYGEKFALPRDENYFGGEVVLQGTEVTFSGYRTQSSLSSKRYERQAYARYPDGSHRVISREAHRGVMQGSHRQHMGALVAQPS